MRSLVAAGTALLVGVAFVSFQSCKTTGANTELRDDSPSQPMLMDFTEPGPNLPPRGRSLFDIITAEGAEQKVPFPLPKLMDRIAQNAPGFTVGEGDFVQTIDPYFTLLIPKGRSIQKSKVDAAHPRVVVAATGGVRKDPGKLGVNYARRLFVGYAEQAESLEVISYNPDAGRFEFQIVKDYAEGKTPKVYYANRALCMTCHHNHGPLFSHSPWSESNSFEATRNLIKAALPGQTSYMGAPIEPVDNGGRQGPAGQMESAARLGGELLDALALYQRFRPVCPPNQPDCAAYKKTNAPEQFRKELHLAAYEDKCLGIYPGDNARLTRLGPIRNAFVKADFPTGVYRPDDLVDDLVPRFGNVADHLQTAIVDPTKRRPFPTQIMVLAFDDGSTSPSPLDWAVRALGDDYEPNCHHLKTIPIAKLE